MFELVADAVVGSAVAAGVAETLEPEVVAASSSKLAMMLKPVSTQQALSDDGDVMNTCETASAHVIAGYYLTWKLTIKWMQRGTVLVHTILTCLVQLSIELWNGISTQEGIQGGGCTGCCSNCELHAHINSFRSISFS